MIHSSHFDSEEGSSVFPRNVSDVLKDGIISQNTENFNNSCLCYRLGTNFVVVVLDGPCKGRSFIIFNLSVFLLARTGHEPPPCLVADLLDQISYRIHTSHFDSQDGGDNAHIHTVERPESRTYIKETSYAQP